MENSLKIAAGGGPSTLAFSSLFRTVLDISGLKPSTIAFELQRERSLVYKWLSGSIVPPASYFPLIAEIVSKRASNTRKMVLANELRALVRRVALPVEIQESILASESIEHLLSACLELSKMSGLEIGHGQGARTDSRRLALILSGALFAAVCGGLLWNALNRILGWPYFMGSGNDALRGLHAFLWGVITIAPVPLPLFLLYRGEERRRLVVPSVMFACVGGLFAFLFFSYGFREAVESTVSSYQLRETIIVVIFAICLSVPPLLTAMLVFSRGRPAVSRVALLLSPTFAALLALLVTLIIDRPPSEILQLRGFVVGFALRLSLFFSLFLATRSKQPV